MVPMLLLLCTLVVANAVCVPQSIAGIVEVATYWAPPTARNIYIPEGSPMRLCDRSPHWRVTHSVINASMAILPEGDWNMDVITQMQPVVVFHRAVPLVQPTRYVHCSDRAGFHIYLDTAQQHWRLDSFDFEDLFAFLAYFHKRDGAPGVFVELGGADGVSQSNTLFYEKKLGWSGYLIEANRFSLNKAAATRPKSKLINAAVCRNRKTVHWLGRGLTAGVVEFMQPAFVFKWHRRHWPVLRDAFGYDGRVTKNASILDNVPRVFRLPCAPVTDLLPVPLHVDFFSLDVEGLGIPLSFCRFPSAC
eukprot:TRINITY_DN16533_c0_g1_i1.p1 TRINITY_DN16533_c0_g1~~TRINITY_DN16533_c0_g1_i1.p1  ORF type:complete len:313 (+),score=34.21 TRINITY_DN16533_c0_g1_i1:26-940(+)